MPPDVRPSWRSLLSRDEPLVLPGAFDALSARLIEQAGFDAFVIGGFPLVGSRYGLPDIGLVGLGEMAAGVRDIVGAVCIPALVDADHGYGDVKNVTHTVHTYERMGVAALLLEDQVAPKRCGHLAGKQVVDTQVMVRKLQAAAAARSSNGPFIIARTDSRAVYGLDEALRRAESYLGAGADGIFIEAPESVEELARIGREFDVPQMCNMLVGGKTPQLSAQDLYGMGFSIIVHGTTLVCGIARALQTMLSELKSDRLQFDPQRFCSLTEFVDIVGMHEWSLTERQFSQ